MVAFETPAPCAFISGFTEHENMVGIPVPHKTAILALEHVQDVFQKHDVLHFGVA